MAFSTIATRAPLAHATSLQGSRRSTILGNATMVQPPCKRVTKRLRQVRPAASVDLGVRRAEAKPGDVDAPISVIIIGAVVVTLASILSGWLLKPGADAAEKIFERDAKAKGKK